MNNVSVYLYHTVMFILCSRMYVCMSVCLRVCLSVCSSICPPGCPPASLYICLSLCPSVYLSVRLSVCLSVCLSHFVYVFVYLSVCLCPYLYLENISSPKLVDTFKMFIQSKMNNNCYYATLADVFHTE